MNDTGKNAEPFRVCTCGKVWRTREELFSDPEARIIGYQAKIEDVCKGIFMFTHTPKDGSCRSTIGFYIEDFVDMCENKYDELMHGTEECEGHCLRIHDLEKCNAPCEAAYIREIAVKIKNWPKRSVPDTH